MPKVSIIIPVYNVEQLIRRCLDTLINQTLNDIEIVVVDDASPDNSMEIVREYKKRDNRIQIVTNNNNSGLMYTRYAGYSQAKGDYYFFCDSDDYLPLDAVENLYLSAIENDSDVVVGSFKHVCEDGREIERRVEEIKKGDESYLAALLNNRFEHSAWGKLYKANLFKDYKYKTLLNFNQAEDLLLSYQIARNVKRWSTISDNVYFYVYNSQSITKVRIKPQNIECIFKAYKITKDVWANTGVISIELEKRRINGAYNCCTWGIWFPTIRKIAKNEGIPEVFSIKRLFALFNVRRAIALLYKAYILSFVRKWSFDIKELRQLK